MGLRLDDEDAQGVLTVNMFDCRSRRNELRCNKNKMKTAKLTNMNKMKMIIVKSEINRKRMK